MIYFAYLLRLFVPIERSKCKVFQNVDLVFHGKKKKQLLTTLHQPHRT